MKKDHEGQRHNSDKVDTTQCPVELIVAVSRVLCKNSKRYGGKYDDRNWEKGMSWSTVVASMERHLVKLKSGELYDEDDGEPHVAKIATNAAFLLRYMDAYKEGNDLNKIEHVDKRLLLSEPWERS